jgi:hypothetical protein
LAGELVSRGREIERISARQFRGQAPCWVIASRDALPPQPVSSGVLDERPGSILANTGCSILIVALISQQRGEMPARRSVWLNRFHEKGNGVVVVSAAGALAEENAADNV